MGKYSKIYYEKNKERSKEYYLNNKTRISIYQKKYRDSDSGKNTHKKWMKNNMWRYHDNIVENTKRYYNKARKGLIEILGNKCVNPECLVVGGCEDFRCLQIDHKDGDGYKDRLTNGRLSYYLKHIDEAKQKLQILCANCNWIKKHDNKENHSKYRI